MRAKTAEERAADRAGQRAAVKRMWPEIGAYCLRNGVILSSALSGRDGIPIDGQKLLARCVAMLLDRYELSVRADVTYDTIVKIVNGRRNPSAAVLDRLIRVLECDPADLFLEDE